MAHTTNTVFNSFLEYNKEQSAKFTDPGEDLSRVQYAANYPVQICVTKCMDGRVNVSNMCKIPVGIIQAFSDLGGKFEVGTHFGEVLLSEQILPAMNKGRDCIVLVTYHWSRGAKERGCKGFHFEVDDAKIYTMGIIRHIAAMCGGGHTVVYPIQVGIETDEDALIFHGVDNKVLDLSMVSSADPDSLRVRLGELFPDMKARMIESLIPLCLGNIAHIASVRGSNRPPSEIDHKENVLGFGRGFDWFHQPNRMLIVGPYAYDLAQPIVVAGKLLLDNLRSGRIPEKDGVTLITSAIYDQLGPYEKWARLKATSLANFAVTTLQREVPELIPHLDVRQGVLYRKQRLFIPMDQAA